VKLAVLVFFVARAALAETPEVEVKELKNLSAEQCLKLPAAELATRCPTIAGRFLVADGKRVALMDRLETRKGTYWCDQDGVAWRCRRIVVIDRELRGARKRNPLAFVTTTELLRLVTGSQSIKLDEEFGALFAPGERPKTCLELPTHGCAVQAARLRAGDRATGNPVVRRRVWLVEDADGPTLQCSDAALSRCDELNAAGWLALIVTLRPSSLQGATPAPEIDLPEVRSDKRPALVLGGADTAETPAGALDPWLGKKNERALPHVPSKADAAKAAKALDARGKPCLTADDRATVDVIFSGEGQLISLLVDGAPANQPLAACLSQVARKMDWPRFSGNTYHLRAVVMRKAH
jgi:hypothetical protein